MAVGFALVEVLGGIALLAELDVLPALGRRGIGRRLIAAARDWAEARGHDALYLTTFAEIPWNAPTTPGSASARWRRPNCTTS